VNILDAEKHEMTTAETSPVDKKDRMRRLQRGIVGLVVLLVLCACGNCVYNIRPHLVEERGAAALTSLHKIAGYPEIGTVTNVESVVLGGLYPDHVCWFRFRCDAATYQAIANRLETDGDYHQGCSGIAEIKKCSAARTGCSLFADGEMVNPQSPCVGVAPEWWNEAALNGRHMTEAHHWPNGKKASMYRLFYDPVTQDLRGAYCTI